jgi:hypothetical protein
MRKMPIIFALLLATTTGATADVLAGGPVYGGTTQTTVLCYFYNAGTSPVTFATKEIIREGAGSEPLTFNNCSTLPAETICVFTANANAGATHACRAVVNPDAALIRGSIEVRNRSGTTLQLLPLR